MLTQIYLLLSDERTVNLSNLSSAFANEVSCVCDLKMSRLLPYHLHCIGHCPLAYELYIQHETAGAHETALSGWTLLHRLQLANARAFRENRADVDGKLMVPVFVCLLDLDILRLGDDARKIPYPTRARFQKSIACNIPTGKPG